MVAELSIIIVSYNQFATTTGPCLQSLAGAGDIPMEIVVIDNGSDRETVRCLHRAAAADGRIKVLFNAENSGFAAANNRGAAEATGRYLLLLNSDTLVPPDVPVRLLSHLQTAALPCLAGPVTNAAGNEQQIHISDPLGPQSVLAQGAEWCRHAEGSRFETDQLSFFCVAMKRDTFLSLDGLDPSFGLGFYEDADFCCRAAEKGVVLQVLEDCFVYHQGSASFSRAGFSVHKLLTGNRKRFKKKHAAYREAHVRWKNLNVLKGYLAQMHAGGADRQYLFANRLARARRLMPNNPLKKVVYACRLAGLERAFLKMKS